MPTATDRFHLGHVVATPGALDALEANGERATNFLNRHQTSDGGEVCNADAEENELSVMNSSRLLSAYSTAKGEKLGVITEADRSCRRSIRGKVVLVGAIQGGRQKEGSLSQSCLEALPWVGAVEFLSGLLRALLRKE
jgi:hypothetical protein